MTIKISERAWRDGGGFYAPGSDTPNAPWNQKDVEITEEHREQARSEIENLLWWSDAWDIYDIIDELQVVMPSNWFTPEHRDMIEQLEIIGEDRGVRAALTIIHDEMKADIMAHAEDWIEERATEIARDG